MATTFKHRIGAEHVTRETTKAQAPEGKVGYLWASLRISLGWIFLWAFLDKLLGLGFATARESAWINGGSPTFGFLSFGTAGPLAPIFQTLAGHPLVDALFMAGLLGIGLALILGIGMRIAAVSGATMMLLMWAAALPPSNNPFMDDHIVYALVLLTLPLVHAGRTWGLGSWWQQTALVERYPVLK